MDLEIGNEEKTHNFSNAFSKELSLHIEKRPSFFSIDRFENNLAICENLETGEIVNIPIQLLPQELKEGYILKFENNSYTLDLEKTHEKQEQIKKLVDNLFKEK